jgi:hypothetical protein
LNSEESSQDATVRTALQSQGVTVTYLQPAAHTSSDTATAAAATVVAATAAAAAAATNCEKSSVALAVARHLYSLGLLAAIWDVGAALRASAVRAGCIQSARVRCVQNSSSSTTVQQQQSTTVLDTEKWLQEGGAAMIRAAIKGADVSTDNSAACLDDGTVVLEVLVMPNSRQQQA